MKFIEQLERFERIITLMSLRATGTLNQLAEKLQISERTLYDYLKALKERGADFYYSDTYQSYYLLTPFEINFGCCSKLELSQTRGGKRFFISLQKFRSERPYNCYVFN
nr:HTH domain-containing protein [uncultured Carboxylicivirga sp.]